MTVQELIDRLSSGWWQLDAPIMIEDADNREWVELHWDDIGGATTARMFISNPRFVPGSRPGDSAP